MLMAVFFYNTFIIHSLNGIVGVAILPVIESKMAAYCFYYFCVSFMIYNGFFVFTE